MQIIEVRSAAVRVPLERPTAIATRQQFSPTDPKAFQMFGRDEFRPVIDGLTIGLQVLLTFVGTLTLGIDVATQTTAPVTPLEPGSPYWGWLKALNASIRNSA